MQDSKAVTQAFLDKIESGDSRLVKQAGDAVNDFIRVKMREEGFAGKIIPKQQLSDDELDRDVTTDKPVKIVDKEPGSPAAITAPFAGLPVFRYIKYPKFRVMFARITTPKFTKDVEELRTSHMDVRQVLSDNALKDMLSEEDTGFIRASNAAMGGAQSATVTETGGVHWKAITGGPSRNNTLEALKVMPRLANRIETSSILINNLTIKDVEKWQRDEVGGDLSEEILLKGFGERELLGRKWIITIKHDLVPEKTMFMYAEPNKLGKFYTLTDATMYVKKEAWFIEFFSYETIGLAIGNVAGVCRADFSTDYNPT